MLVGGASVRNGSWRWMVLVVAGVLVAGCGGDGTEPVPGAREGEEAAAADSQSPEGLRRINGLCVMGHEVRTFLPCGSKKVYWIQTDQTSLEQLQPAVERLHRRALRTVLRDRRRSIELGGRRGFRRRLRRSDHHRTAHSTRTRERTRLRRARALINSEFGNSELPSHRIAIRISTISNYPSASEASAYPAMEQSKLENSYQSHFRFNARIDDECPKTQN